MIHSYLEELLKYQTPKKCSPPTPSTFNPFYKTLASFNGPAEKKAR